MKSKVKKGAPHYGRKTGLACQEKTVIQQKKKERKGIKRKEWLVKEKERKTEKEEHLLEDWRTTPKKNNMR